MMKVPDDALVASLAGDSSPKVGRAIARDAAKRARRLSVKS
jgi:hypothetical protein